MINIEQQAAQVAAMQLRALLLRHGAQADDLHVETTSTGAQLRGVRSAGLLAEYGSRARGGVRRMGRAIEALRQGGAR